MGPTVGDFLETADYKGHNPISPALDLHFRSEHQNSLRLHHDRLFEPSSRNSVLVLEMSFFWCFFEEKMAKKLHRKFATKDYVGFLVSICSGPAQ